MAEASKSSGKPMTTASFIEQLQQAKLNSSSEPTTPQTSVSETVLKTEQSTTANDAPSNMEGLSDSDLQTLLQNFKDLSTEEQHGLITYLKKLEAKEPERVERLRKFVNLGLEKPEKPTSPFSARLGGVNPTNVDDPFGESQFVEDEKEDEDGYSTRKGENKLDKEPSKIHIDSDEEEYTFDDVFQAANKRVKEKELEKEKEKQSDKPDMKINLSDAKALINNIMGSLNSRDGGNLFGLKSSSNNTTTTSASLFDNTSTITTGSIVHAMDNISAENVKNLESIVGNLQGKLIGSIDMFKSGDNPRTSSSNFQPASSNNFRTNFNPNMLSGESSSRSNQNLDGSRSPQRNPMNSNASVNQNPAAYGQNIRSDGQNLNRNPLMQQNVQYPMKNIYGGYSQNSLHSNPGNLNRAPAPPQQFGNQNFGYDNRYGFNDRSNTQGGNNSSGNRW